MPRPSTSSGAAADLAHAGDAVSVAFTHVDKAIGQLVDPEHSAALLLRAELSGVIRRLNALRVFVADDQP